MTIAQITLCCLALPALVTAQSGSKQTPPGAAGFWNTKGTFAGTSVCAACHPAEAAKFRGNSMSRALERIDQCSILRGNIHYTFRNGIYAYSIRRSGGKILYTVTDGSTTFEAPLEYAFGQGKAGQTYVYSIGGEYYESRVSYYTKINALDFTVGPMNAKPENLKAAAGRVMMGNEPRNCFGCHTTGARVGAALQLTHYEEGVQCEACHGPGESHVKAVREGNALPGSIRSLREMGPRDSNEFCGSCHRTWEAVMMMGIKGINTARFPSYRLTNSPCFSLDDARISCTACHDPHGPLVTEDRYYDAKCIACHNRSNVSLRKKTCPVGKQDCTSCHMQRVEPAEAHHAFPDHWFRIIKPKAAYPD